MTSHPNRNWRRRLISQAAEFPPNLVSAWLSIFPAQSRLSRALYITRRTGVFCDPNTLAAWARGARSVPEPAQRLMRYEMLMLLLGTELADALSPVLEPPDRRELPALTEQE